jgi:hypothetical protein
MYVAAVLLYDSLDGVQPESGALPDCLGREKRFEHVRFYFRGNTRAIVANFNHYTGIITVGSDAKLAVSAHRVYGVVDQIGPDLA